MNEDREVERLRSIKMQLLFVGIGFFSIVLAVCALIEYKLDILFITVPIQIVSMIIYCICIYMEWRKDRHKGKERV